jgi:pyruvate/2-oxoglutarate dehydrogenase complex dihydrolipoamide dehydrogenase (E3) component
LEAARGARLAGHDVVLHERSDHLGGNFVVGAIPPGKGELTSYITLLREELCRLGVQIELCSTVTADTVRGEAPDVVVYAGGAKHLRPSIPGIDGGNVVDACDVLTGRATTGHRVIIAGGGMIGSETALYLASIGRQVTVVDQLPEVALEENASRRYYLMKEFDQYRVEAVVNATITSFADTAVEVNQDDKPRTLTCDTVVLALGMMPDVELLDSMREVAEVKVIGDAADAADGLKASREGFLCGLSL